MNLLIVYTHPNHDSLNHAFLEAVLQGIKNHPKELAYQVLDLYQEGFNPVLTFNKDKRRRDMHLEPEMAPYREQLLWADHVIYIYPIFWGRPPAMLLGYIDRLFSTNFAYRYKKMAFQVEGLLGGKQVTVISTMKGPTGYMRFFLGNAHQQLMKKALFNFVGIKKIKFFEFGYMEEKKGPYEKNLSKIRRYIETLPA